MEKVCSQKEILLNFHFDLIIRKFIKPCFQNVSGGQTLDRVLYTMKMKLRPPIGLFEPKEGK